MHVLLSCRFSPSVSAAWRFPVPPKKQTCPPLNGLQLCSVWMACSIFFFFFGGGTRGTAEMVNLVAGA